MRRTGQSDYATFRQTLVANSGLSAHRLRQELRDPFPTPQAAEGKVERQCPSCAWHLYHSDHFRFNWVKYCPLHKEPLISKCPKCERPWPDIHSLRFDDCDICGLPRINEIPGRLLPDSATEPFQRLGQFIEASSRGTNMARSWDWADQIDATCWQDCDARVCFRVLTPDSCYFPAFQSFWYPEFTSSILRSLGVETRPLSLQEHSTRVTPWRIPDISDRTRWRHYRAKDRLIRTPRSKTLASVNKVAKEITAWVRQNAPGHHLRIGFCGGSLEGYLEQDVIPCPFCLAFSMWWAIVTQRYFNPKGALRSGHFMFTESLRYRPWPTLLERVLIDRSGLTNIHSETQFLKPEWWFQQWLFERNLQLAFKEMFDLSSFLYLRFEVCRTKSEPTAWDPANRFKRSVSSSELIAVALKENRLLVWCSDDNPIDTIKAVSPTHLPLIHQDGLDSDSPLWGWEWNASDRENGLADGHDTCFNIIARELQRWGWNKPWYRAGWYRL